ncbi:hypothetical protein QLL95_gp0135 [Cotonvirus japonicus]|uniref:RING-type domain-containing protein n=1 Tax=Cotonvirus japonicus TaxID=2811091 RepID=A0ABM7NR48_9VIRU|nr:hypothetical protein QLL95_gp0135 [Cotonvirus japonicus]BCS82624.1 hypothetical protein [Cotonvirus japonicus]
MDSLIECYNCEKTTNDINLYYLIGIHPEYIDPITYQQPIPSNAKPICSECTKNFILSRQCNRKNCTKCNGSYSINGKLCFLQQNDQKPKQTNDYFHHFTSPKDENCKICSIKVTIPYTIGGESEGLQQVAWVGFVGPNIFSEWLGDTYQIDSDEIVADAGNVVCEKCLENFKSGPHLSVECNLCKKKFQAMMPGSKTQGVECSSSVRDHCIYGSYGSHKYDLNNPIMFVDSRPKYIKYKSSVCDECITELINKGICTWDDRYDN